MLRVVCAFDPDTGAELARLSSTIQPSAPQLSDVQMIHATRSEFVRLHSLTQLDADRARYEVHEAEGDAHDGGATSNQETSNASS